MYTFDKPELCIKLREVLKEWEGTPFRHRTCVKGLGCDCIHFVGGVLHEVGVFNFKPKQMLPEYAPDWHMHNTRDLLYEGVLKNLNVERVTSPQTGDILLYFFGQAASHAGLYIDGYVYGAVNGTGVIKMSFEDEEWLPKLKYILRLKS